MSLFQAARCCRDRSYKKEELQAFVLLIAIVCLDSIKSYAIGELEERGMAAIYPVASK
jgi:hypothetical protein